MALTKQWKLLMYFIHEDSTLCIHYEEEHKLQNAETLYFAGTKRYCCFSVSTVEYLEEASICTQKQKEMRQVTDKFIKK